MTQSSEVMPSSPGAERYVITCCLNSTDAIIDIANQLKADDFFYSLYKYSYQICLSLLEDGMVPEPMTIYNRLEAMGVAEPKHLKELELLSKASFDKQNLSMYIEKIKGCSARRQLIEAQKSSISELYSNDDLTPDQAVTDSESRILTVSNKLSNVVDVHRIGCDSFSVAIQRANSPVEVPGIPTGFSKLDMSMQGLQPGKLYVVAARYKVGKSMWLLNVVTHVAVDLGVPVLFIDTENPSRQIDDRFISRLSGVDEMKIKNGMFVNEEGALQKIEEASDRLATAEIYHHYMPNFTFEAMVSLIKKYKMQKNIGLVVFDYIKAPDNTDFTSMQEYQLLGYLTSGLKNKIAGALDIPVITACQLGRSAIGKGNGSDEHVADSDRIGRYADMLIFLREKTENEAELYGNGPKDGNLVMSIHANRGGPARDFYYDLWFDRPKMLMKEVRARKYTY